MAAVTETTEGATLRDALRGLADSDGLVAAEALRQVAGFDDDVAAVLESELGPGPWQASLLESLIGTAKVGQHDENQNQEKLKPHMLSPIPSPLRRRRCAVTPAEEGDDDEEGEWAELGEIDGDDENGFHHLAAAVTAALKTSSLEDQSLLRRIWRLARSRDHQRQTLQQQLALVLKEAKQASESAFKAEAARAAVELAEASRSEEAQELLEAAQARLLACRDSLRQSQADRDEAYQRAEQLEADRLRQLKRMRQLEERLRRSDEDRKAAEEAAASAMAHSCSCKAAVSQETALLQDDNFIPNDGASRHLLEEEWKRRLSVAEEALEATHEELQASELRYQEALNRSRQRAIDLEAELSESREKLAECEERLKVKLPIPLRGALSEELEEVTKDRGEAEASTAASTPASLAPSRPARLKDRSQKHSQRPLPHDLGALGRLLSGGGLLGRKT
eukprot:TRINITY_DN6081_c1_g1_i3.p1 TRINITY_DN6081_c1_g1~~TRINITY_DN6081_c1_g1_i3.p1  ORF type:complete len:460 (+),score=142.99 TRINITY_DN6081_c1_g1_i3:30-1382(+)